MFFLSRKKRSKLFFLSMMAICGLTLLFVFSSCELVSFPKSSSDDLASHTNGNWNTSAPTPTVSPTPTVLPTPTPYKKTASLVAVGDIMVHQPQIDNAYQPATKTYDMSGYFEEVRDRLQQGDWVIANLETTLAGKDAGGYSGYPMFNSPDELADAIRSAGFNIVTTANNHSLDRREKGVIRTLEVLKQRGLLSTGTYATAEDAENQQLLVTHNEITIGFLSYSYGTNGIPFPEGKEYLVNLIDEQKMISDIVKIRNSGADLVSVSLHFGNEYQRTPSELQVALSEKLVRAGADLILGSHPHVVQPIQWMYVKEADGRTRKALVVYSMGNFISSQVRDYKDIGVIVNVQVSKSFPDGIAQIDSYQATSTYVYRDLVEGKRRLTIMPLDGEIERYRKYEMNQATIDLLANYQTEMDKHLIKRLPVYLTDDQP